MTAIPDPVLGAVELQYSTDNVAAIGDVVNWTTFGRAVALGSVIRTRRFALPPGNTVTARFWRVIKTTDPAATNWGTAVFNVDQLAAWVEEAELETGEVPQVMLTSFNYDDASQRYIIPFTAGNSEVWRASEWMAGVVEPFAGDQVPLAMATQSLDTMINFHQQVAPNATMRQGAHTEWDSRPLTFTSLPVYAYNPVASYDNGADEVQQLTFDSYEEDDTFNITLEEATTTPISYDTDMTTLAASIVAALEALANVGPGNVSATSSGAGVIDVTFIGLLADSDVGVMAPVTITSVAGGVSVAVLTEGQPGGEPIISPTRGWPACGCFYQQRLYMMGLGSLPETVLGSLEGSYFEFNDVGPNAASAINETMDTEAVTAIRSCFAGRNLQVFTNSAEFWFPIEPIEPPSPIKLATRRGCLAGSIQAAMDLTTLFIGEEGNALYAYSYDLFLDNYKSQNLAVFASHIVNGVIDMGFRKHVSTTDTDIALLPRSDGTMGVMVALTDQDITGFVPWSTEGQFLAATAEMAGDLYVATARQVNGQTKRFLERVDATHMLDCSTLVAADDASIDGVTVTGGRYLAGMTVSLYIDGADAGDIVMPVSGTFELPYAPQTSLEYGLNFVPTLTTLPMVFQQDQRGGASMRVRTGDVNLLLGPSANLWGGLVGGRLYRVPLKRRPTALLDQGPGESAFTGWTRLNLLPGLREDAQITFTQPRPGPLQIQEIVVTAST